MNKFKTLLTATFLSCALIGAAQAKTFVYCSEGSPEGFDPALYTSGTTFDASSKPIYNRLVQFIPGSTQLEPGLAESWEVSDDGMEVTFKLRPGVKYHTTDFFTPTRDFNADDVLFSFNRQMDKDNPFHAYVDGASWEYFNGMSMPELIKSIDKVDDMTVKFTLNKPDAPFLANLAMDFASILSSEYANKLASDGSTSDLNQKPIGTGAFKFQAYQPDAVIRYQAHPEYWGKKQAIQNLIFAISTDASVRQQKLAAGECHLMPYPNPGDIKGLKANKDLKIDEQQGLNIGYLAYNTMQAPFDNAKVRKALSMAINKQAILDTVFQGTGQAAKNPIPPTMWSYNDAIEPYPYDPEAAKAMLAQEGVKDLSMKIWAMPVQRPYNPNARRMAEVIQEDLSKIGVKVEIVSYEWGEYLERSKAKDRDGAVLLGWTGDNGDPDNFLAVLLGCDAVGGSNRAQWCNEEFNTLIQKAKQGTQEERTKLYEEAQVVFKREAPWATIAHSLVFIPMRKEVEGYVLDPLGGHSFVDVDLAQ